MSSCQYSLNSDISGIGVRISFYLQTLFLGCLSARSGSLDKISGALYTLMATNTAMAISGLILGLKPIPEISFQDAVIILYLLSMAWITVIASLASCNHLSDDTKVLQLGSIIQSYAIVAFAFAVLGQAEKFGETPKCNQDAVAVIFRPFSALKSGRILGWVIISLVVAGYTIMTTRDYTARVLKKIRGRESVKEVKETPPPDRSRMPPVANFIATAMPQMPVNTTAPRRQTTDYGTPRALVDGRLLFMLFFILLFWGFFVLNTELVIRGNRPAQGNSDTSWQFGQILPMFLTLLPLTNMINAFNRFGIKPTKQVDMSVKVSVIYDVGFEHRMP